MTAITDIQRSLNAIRAIERESSVDVRLAALALITATSADIAKELRGAEPKPKPKRKQAAAPTANTAPKPALTVQPPQPQTPAVREPRPFTEPDLVQKRD